MHRALQEPAINGVPQELCANHDSTYIESPAYCPIGFYFYRGMCYTATRREVLFGEARLECESISGRLVTDHSLDVVETLVYLSRYYIQADIFTGYRTVDSFQSIGTIELTDSNVELVYKTGRLQYIGMGQRRGFVCAVDQAVANQLLANNVALPSGPEEVLVNDLRPTIVIVPPQPIILPLPKLSIEPFLVDLLQFTCKGNFTNYPQQESDLTLYRADLTHISRYMPYGCHYVQTLGNLVADSIDTNNVISFSASLDHKSCCRRFRDCNSCAPLLHVSTDPITPTHVSKALLSILNITLHKTTALPTTKSR